MLLQGRPIVLDNPVVKCYDADMNINAVTDTPNPANDNADPFPTVASTLDCLYQLRQEVLQESPAAMSFERRRSREEALKKFAQAEALLLGEI
jgi:hypothetical protein